MAILNTDYISRCAAEDSEHITLFRDTVYPALLVTYDSRTCKFAKYLKVDVPLDNENAR